VGEIDDRHAASRESPNDLVASDPLRVHDLEATLPQPRSAGKPLLSNHHHRPVPITIRGDVDERAVAQLRRCADVGGAVAGALCANAHVGYSQPIGGAIAYPDHKD
jgi:hypothetical protein